MSFRGSVCLQKEILVGEIRRPREPVERRDVRAGPGVEHDDVGFVRRPARAQHVRRVERRLRAHELARAFLEMILDAGTPVPDDAAHALHDRRNVGPHVAVHVHVARAPRAPGHVRRSEKRLGRRAADVDAAPAEVAALEQHDPLAALRKVERKRNPSLPGPDDGEIVTHRGIALRNRVKRPSTACSSFVVA